MLVDEDATYELIEKMIAQFAECYGSRRIHIGMDEAHDLGRGRFLDLNGYERAYDLFNRHLTRVVEICNRHGLKPMLWSDMYFRMGSKTGAYYDTESVVPRRDHRGHPRRGRTGLLGLLPRQRIALQRLDRPARQARKEAGDGVGRLDEPQLLAPETSV